MSRIVPDDGLDSGWGDVVIPRWRGSSVIAKCAWKASGALVRTLATYWGHETSEVAQVILRLATKEQLPTHLLLGSDAAQYARLAEDKRESDAKVWLDVSVLTEADGYRCSPL